MEIYSLGSPKALTQLLYQRLCLPLLGDVGEQLPENTHNTSSTQCSEAELYTFSMTNESQFVPELAEYRNSLHDGIEVL